MRFKVIIIGLLFVLVTFTAIGLVGAESQPFAGQTLNVVVCSDPFADAVRYMLPQFEKETGIKVNYDPLSFMELQQKLMVTFASKSPAYDVISMFCGWAGEWEKAGWVEDLNSRYNTLDDPADILPGAKKAWEWNGKLLGIPYAPYYYLVFYREDLYKKAGIEPPVTMDDWVKNAEKFYDPKQNLYSWSNAYQRGAPIVQDSVAWLAGFGGSLLKDPGNGDFTPTLSSRIGIQTYNFYKSMLKYAPPGTVSFDFQQRSEAYDQGRIATQGNWSAMCAPRMDPAKSALAVNEYTRYTSLPVLSKTDNPKVPFGGWGLSINSYSKKQDAAWEFIKWYTQKKVMVTYIEQGGSPFRYSTLNEPALKADNAWFNIIEKAEKTGSILFDYLPRIPEYSKMEEIYGQYLNGIMIGKYSVEVGLEKADQDIKTLLKTAGYKMK